MLILDELGYLPARARKPASSSGSWCAATSASLIVTSNKSFVDWGEVFNDQVLATAILDRLLHHATTLNIKGESYRLREKKKAGLLGRRVRSQRRGGDRRIVTTRAVEMTRLWKSQNDFHRSVEISRRTRGFHIPTAPHPQVSGQE